MLKDYSILDRFCDASFITYEEFGEIIGMNHRTLYGIIHLGDSPSKKSTRIINKWFNENRELVKRILSNEIIAMATDSTPIIS